MLKNKLQHYFVKFLAKNLFNVITQDDILRVFYTGDGNLDSVIVQNKRITDDQIGVIAEQARNLKKSSLWRHLENDIKHQTNIKMFNKSQAPADIMAGKMVLWTLSKINDKLEELARLASYEPTRVNKS